MAEFFKSESSINIKLVAVLDDCVIVVNKAKNNDVCRSYIAHFTTYSYYGAPTTEQEFIEVYQEVAKSHIKLCQKL